MAKADAGSREGSTAPAPEPVDSHSQFPQHFIIMLALLESLLPVAFSRETHLRTLVELGREARRSCRGPEARRPGGQDWLF